MLEVHSDNKGSEINEIKNETKESEFNNTTTTNNISSENQSSDLILTCPHESDSQLNACNSSNVVHFSVDKRESLSSSSALYSVTDTEFNESNARIINSPISNASACESYIIIIQKVEDESPIIDEKLKCCQLNIDPDIIYKKIISNKIVQNFTFTSSIILFIAFSLLCLVVGILSIDKCPINHQIPIYLIVFGAACLMRLFLAYMCPFSYKNLFRKKFKKPKSNKKLPKIEPNRQKNYCDFFNQFSFCKKNECNEDCKSENISPSIQISHASDANMSQSATSTALSSINTNQTAETYFSSNSNSKRSSNSFASVVGSKYISRLQEKSTSNFSKRSVSTSNSVFSFVYFKFRTSTTSLTIGQPTRKRFRYERTKLYRIIDCSSIRYGLAKFLAQLLNLFIVAWFVYGNYLVFNIKDIVQLIHSVPQATDMALNALFNLNIIARKNGTSDQKLGEEKSVINVKKNYCDRVCYNTALFQILFIYAFTVFLFVSLIIYQIISILLHRYASKKKQRAHV